MRATISIAVVGFALLMPTARAQSGDGYDERPDVRARSIVRRLEAGTLGADDAATRLLELGPGAHAAVGEALSRLDRVSDVRAMLWVLAEQPSPIGRDLMLGLAGDRRPAVRAAVAQNLGAFAEDGAITATLLRLGNDADDEVAEAALGTLSKVSFDVWRPLLGMLVMELGSFEPRTGRTYPLFRALEAALGRDPAPLERVRELLAACESLGGAAAEELFGILPRSRAPGVMPLLVRLVVESCPAAPARGAAEAGEEAADLASPSEEEDPALLELVAEGGPLDALRPLSEPLVALVVEQLGKARYVRAFDAVRGASLDVRPAVRRAAMAALIPCAPDEDARLIALRTLAETLGSGDRGLRSEAFALLRRHTKVTTLGVSQAAWLVWVEKQEARRAQLRELADRAREAGFATVEELLQVYPELAPAEEEEEGEDDARPE